MLATSITEHRIVTGHLYASSTRLPQRASTLHTARIRGADATAACVGVRAVWLRW